MLYPQQNELRVCQSLDGIWRFRQDTKNEGIAAQWNKHPIRDSIPMPVPSSYNDITQSQELRDHVGFVWYERELFIPHSLADQRLLIRVGAASHTAIIFINGQQVGEHIGGYLPFEFDITDYVKVAAANRLTIALDNRLGYDSLPLGKVIELKDRTHPEGYVFQDVYSDFFNFGGIHRPVYLIARSEKHIEDITVRTAITGSTAAVSFEIEAATSNIDVTVLDKRKKPVGNAKGAKGSITIANPELWDTQSPTLYTLEVRLFDESQNMVDIYRQTFGIRTIEVNGLQVLLNGKPVYFRGFGKHEDMDIKGKGLDHALLIKDFNLMKWMGAIIPAIKYGLFHAAYLTSSC